MRKLLIRNATIVSKDSLIKDQAVLCEAGEITRVGPSSQLGGERADEVVDADGCYLAPGFIDLHLHGTREFLVDNGAHDLEEICRLLPRYGVTGFLPGTAALWPPSEDKRFISALAGIRSPGAEILGFHFEGPFLSLTGAIPPEALGAADPGRVRQMIESSGPYRAIFSISPELDGILDLIPIMAQNGTPVFMTHTAATVEQTQSAIDAGVRHATHFYDVFPCPPVKEPGARPCGAVEAVLADPRVTVDFILDGEHVHPVALKMALQCKGDDGVSLITDANIGAGMPPGQKFRSGAYDVVFAYEGGPARMTDNGPFPGALSGSGLTLDMAVRNAVRLLGVDLPQAVRMASANPARVLHLEANKGQVGEGFDADLVLLGKDLRVKGTWVGGEPRFAME
jgi:N-acetylglucosamine-6-phosphate deacetylase